MIKILIIIIINVIPIITDILHSHHVFFFWSLILVVSVIQNTHPMQWPLCTVHTIIADKETVEH